MKTKKEKIKAFELRKEGKSYGQISEILNVNKSTISYWFKNIDWSQDIKKQLIDKSRALSSKRLLHLNALKKQKWANHYLMAEREALAEFDLIKNDRLFITGIAIYWGEGDKFFENGNVRVSNIDERLLYKFNEFLVNICNVDRSRIKAGILLYPDLDPLTCLKFWSKSIKIAEENFFKSTVIMGRHKTRKVSNGVCSIQLSDKYLKKKILTWLDLFAK